MADFDDALETIRLAHAEIGTAELSRISGVPYTTLRDAVARDFRSPVVETLEKLAAAARTHLTKTHPDRASL